MLFVNPIGTGNTVRCSTAGISKLPISQRMGFVRLSKPASFEPYFVRSALWRQFADPLTSQSGGGGRALGITHTEVINLLKERLQKGQAPYHHDYDVVRSIADALETTVKVVWSALRDHTRTQRDKLIKTGKNDSECTEAIAAELGLNPKQTWGRIRIDIYRGNLPFNPNNTVLNPRDPKYKTMLSWQEELTRLVISRRKKYPCYPDEKIAKMISSNPSANTNNKSAEDILKEIKHLVDRKILPRNSWREKRRERMLKAYQELQEKIGPSTPYTIAKAMAGLGVRGVFKTGEYKFRMIEHLLYEALGLLGQHWTPNSQKASPETIKTRKQLRKKLMQQGFSDRKISERIAPRETSPGRTLEQVASTIMQYFTRSVDPDNLPTNPNNPRNAKKFADRLVKREELIKEGLTDWQISVQVAQSETTGQNLTAQQLGHKRNNVLTFYKRLERKGKLPANPNTTGGNSTK